MHTRNNAADHPHHAAQLTQQERLLMELEAHLLADEPIEPLFYGGFPNTPYVCPVCGTLWSIDPTGLRVGQVIPTTLHPGYLAPALCRPCSRAHIGGVLEVDQYGGGAGGFGYNWEADQPQGGHILVSLFDSSWMDRAQRSLSRDLLEIVSQPETARRVLTWLADQRVWPQGKQLSTQDALSIARSNPPGHGSPGLCWKGMGFPFQGTSPLRPGSRESLVLLSVAVPPQEPLNRDTLLRIGQLVARLSSTIQLPGEPLDVARLRHAFHSKAWLFQKEAHS